MNRKQQFERAVEYLKGTIFLQEELQSFMGNTDTPPLEIPNAIWREACKFVGFHEETLEYKGHSAWLPSEETQLETHKHITSRKLSLLKRAICERIRKIFLFHKCSRLVADNCEVTRFVIDSHPNYKVVMDGKVRLHFTGDNGYPHIKNGISASYLLSVADILTDKRYKLT